MPIPEEVLSRYVDAEMALRRQLFLRGYELGTGGERLEPDAAVAFLDTFFPPVLADALQAIREERHDLRKAGESAISAMRTLLAETDEPVAADAALPAQPSPATWKSVRARELVGILAGGTGFVVVRKGGQRGLVCAPLPPGSPWQKLARRLFPGRTALSVRWEGGTVSALPPDDRVEWCPLRFPS